MGPLAEMGRLAGKLGAIDFRGGDVGTEETSRVQALRYVPANGKGQLLHTFGNIPKHTKKYYSYITNTGDP